MKFKRISTLFFILSLSILGGCSQAPEVSKTKISVGYLGSAAFPGGLYIVAKSKNGHGEIIRTATLGDDIELDLPKGEWSFSAIGWDGSENFEGDVFCGRNANVKVDADEFNVVVNATEAGCANIGNQATGVFNPVDGDNDFYSLDFTNCIGVNPYIEMGFTLPGNIICGMPGVPIIGGFSQSVEITLMQRGLDGGVFPGLTSDCQIVSSNMALTSIKLPVGHGLENVMYKVDLYGNGTCTGPKKEFHFRDGFKSHADNFQGTAVVDNGTSTIKVVLNEDACVGNQATTNGPFAAGNDTQKTYLICNEAQWNQIANEGVCPATTGDINTMGISQSCESDATYILGQNINFGGTNTTINTGYDFDGELRGSGFALQNGNAPLFYNIVTNPNTGKKTYITDLEIENFVISTGAFPDLGILAHSASSVGDSDTNGIEISRVHIDHNSSVENTSGGVGGTGAFIGRVNMTSAIQQSDRFSLRLSSSEANVRSTSLSSDITPPLDHTSLMATGGLFGKTIGGVSNGDISLELNGLALFVFDDEDGDGEGPNPSDASITPVEVDGYMHVGGLIGHAENTEVRYGNVGRVNLTGMRKVGGMIGSTGDTVAIKDSIMVINSYTESASCAGDFQCTMIGGAVGFKDVDMSLKIEGVITNLNIDTLSYHTEQIGGIIGMSQDAGSSALTLEDSKSLINVQVNGRHLGGLIGQGSFFSSGANAQVSRNVVKGLIHQDSTHPNNHDRGGLVGRAVNGRFENNIVHEFYLEGHSILGGFVGYADDVVVQGGYIAGGIDADLPSTGSVVVGGVFGSLETAGGSITGVKMDADIVLSQSTEANCASANCGLLIGFNNFTGFSMNYNLITLGKTIGIPNGGGPDSAYCAVNCIGGGTNYDNLYADDTTAGNCTAVGGGSEPFHFDGTNSICYPDFKWQWGLAGYDATEQDYRTGSLVEPFLVESPADWNQIGDNQFLMEKSFEVIGEVSFASDSITPIGSSANPFKGAFFGDGEITNVNETIGATGSVGLFRSIDGAQIGLRDRPLFMRNISLIANSATNIGVIGEILTGGSSEVFLVVDNGDMASSNTGARVGGLIGAANGNFEVETSGFLGKVVASGASSYAGGIIGHIIGGSNAKITNSYAKLNLVSSGFSAGGLVGSSFGSNFTIEHSYVWIDTNQQNPGNDIVGTFIAGLLGENDGTSLNIRDSYVDYTNSTVPGGANNLATNDTGGAGTVSGNAIIGPDQGDGTYATAYKDPDHATLIGNGFDADNKWSTDSGGRIVQEWEIEGFEL